MGEKVTEEVLDNVVELIRKGTPMVTACRMLRINDRTVSLKMTQGKRGQSPEAVDFYQRVLQARAEHESSLVHTIVRAVEKDDKNSPEHAKWLLMKQYRQRWGNHLDNKSEIDLIMARLDRMSNSNMDEKKMMEEMSVLMKYLEKKYTGIGDDDVESPQLPERTSAGIVEGEFQDCVIEDATTS